MTCVLFATSAAIHLPPRSPLPPSIPLPPHALCAIRSSKNDSYSSAVLHSTVFVAVLRDNLYTMLSYYTCIICTVAGGWCYQYSRLALIAIMMSNHSPKGCRSSDPPGIAASRRFLQNTPPPFQGHHNPSRCRENSAVFPRRRQHNALSAEKRG